MKKYKIVQIIILIGAIYFLLMAWFITLIKGVHVNFETAISDGAFESKMNWITPIPKLKKISIPLAKIEQVILREDKSNDLSYYSLEFKCFNKFNSSMPGTIKVTLMSKQYEYAQRIKEEISDALQNQKEFKCELFSLDIPIIRKFILTFYIFSVTFFIVFIIVFILGKKETEKRKTSNSLEGNKPNNINDSIIK